MSRPVFQISDAGRRCLIEATIEPLRPYRRGYARSKAGPFHKFRVVLPLVRQGALRIIKDRAGRKPGSVTARAQ